MDQLDGFRYSGPDEKIPPAHELKKGITMFFFFTAFLILI